MMLVKNWETGEAKEVDTLTYCNDMDRLCICPECMQKIKFGDLINTDDWYDTNGIWRVGICSECATGYWKKKGE